MRHWDKVFICFQSMIENLELGEGYIVKELDEVGLSMLS